MAERSSHKGVGAECDGIKGIRLHPITQPLLVKYMLGLRGPYPRENGAHACIDCELSLKPYQVCASIVIYKNDLGDVLSAVRSVLSAPLRVTCTVVDNSPTPDLRRSIEESGAKYIHAGKNLGFGGGHNVALRADRDLSEYHLVLNPDVHFTPDVLCTLYQFMNENQHVGQVMPKILYPDGTEQCLCKQIPSPLELLSRRFLGKFGRSLFAAQLGRYELRHLDLGVTREIPCLSGCFMFVRSEALSSVGFFDERFFMYMEDVDLCRRIGAQYSTVFYPGVFVTHGYAKGSYSNLTLLKHHMQSAFRYFLKWGWIYDPERSRLNRNTTSLPLNCSGQKPQHDAKEQIQIENSRSKARR